MVTIGNCIPHKITFFRAIIAGMTAIYLIFALLYIREGGSTRSGLNEWIVEELRTGSTFIDSYEFANAYDKFGNRPYLLGKTYAGDALGFLPLGVSTYRDHYKWKEWTKELFDVSEYKGGFRLTTFGEPYFNFGIPGVVIKGLVLGAAYGVLDVLVVLLSLGFRAHLLRSAKRHVVPFVMTTCFVSVIDSTYNSTSHIVVFVLVAFISVTLSVLVKTLTWHEIKWSAHGHSSFE